MKSYLLEQHYSIGVVFLVYQNKAKACNRYISQREVQGQIIGCEKLYYKYVTIVGETMKYNKHLTGNHTTDWKQPDLLRGHSSWCLQVIHFLPCTYQAKKTF